MIVLSPLDYSLINKLSLVKVGSIFSGIYLIVYLFLYWTLYLLKLRSLANFISIFLFYWVLFSGYLFPMIQKSGMQDPLDIPDNMTNFFMVLVLSFLFTIILKTKLRKGIIVFTTVFYH